ncbi:MAG: hypothetical protein Ct9H300mP11_28470 [Chloroflexota bacterium]|nr:MAG: hypothetical protein Ct9H300mP11_28470 [Chloroflexota bacterium]
MLMCPETERRQVSLRVFNNEPTARMAEQRLQMAGIPCLIRSPSRWRWPLGDALTTCLTIFWYIKEDQVWASEVLGIVLREQDEDLSSGNSRWKVILASTVIVSLITFVLAVGNQ